MNRSEVLQEIRLMKFDDLYSRRTAGKLTQEQAAEILGISVGTMRRWEERYEAEGAEGLYDRRLGKLANNRVPADTAMEMLELFDTRYWDYTPKHFHEKLVAHHGFTQPSRSRLPARHLCSNRHPGQSIARAWPIRSPASGCPWMSVPARPPPRRRASA